MLITTSFQTPIGMMRVIADDDGICVFDFQYRRMMDSIVERVKKYKNVGIEEGTHPYIEQLIEQIGAYFSGTRKAFDLPLQLLGTEFQQRVWRGLMEVPYGMTRSYKQQSLFLGDEKAIRAVARANGENGIAIIIPCHRIIGTNGTLVGYGGGLHRKNWLLEHERKYSGLSMQPSLFA